jgi:integrase
MPLRQGCRGTRKLSQPGFNFHELRHYYASLLTDSGASVKVVQARLDHKSAEETLNTYSHL